MVFVFTFGNKECLSGLTSLMYFSKRDVQKNHDKLLRPMDNCLLNESLWNDKCDYILPDFCINLKSRQLQPNSISTQYKRLISHQLELKHLLNTLSTKNTTVDVVLLCETS